MKEEKYRSAAFQILQDLKNRDAFADSMRHLECFDPEAIEEDIIPCWMEILEENDEA